jgi:hypothetical protein
MKKGGVDAGCRMTDAEKQPVYDIRHPTSDIQAALSTAC